MRLFRYQLLTFSLKIPELAKCIFPASWNLLSITRWLGAYKLNLCHKRPCQLLSGQVANGRHCWETGRQKGGSSVVWIFPLVVHHWGSQDKCRLLGSPKALELHSSRVMGLHWTHCYGAHELCLWWRQRQHLEQITDFWLCTMLPAKCGNSCSIEATEPQPSLSTAILDSGNTVLFVAPPVKQEAQRGSFTFTSSYSVFQQCRNQILKCFSSSPEWMLINMLSLVFLRLMDQENKMKRYILINFSYRPVLSESSKKLWLKIAHWEAELINHWSEKKHWKVAEWD